LKEHIEAYGKANREIRDAEVRLARVHAEIEKYTKAREAAAQGAGDLREKAQRALAMAAVGEDDDGDAPQLLAEAERAEKKAGDLSTTLAGLADVKARTEQAIVSARAERALAVKSALEEHAAAVVKDYEAAATRFIAARRRVHAVERIRSTVGDKRNLLRSGDIEIPAPVGYIGPVMGAYSDLLYSSRLDLARMGDGPLSEAVDNELDLLASIGLEV
jgi:hypothetical protein